ncbi:MAG: leucine-rich repeat domain-containing protein [Christensenellaceae bacterium]|nr:leucine-rich repeat domain-containing protein [Christensenellaceae bacterium]
MSSVLIWGDITNIGKKAFKNCNSLDSISIPSSCKVIEESAFEACTDMDDILLWGDTNIGNSAFRGCTSLEEISIPSGTEYIGDYAFEGCSNLENVILWGNSTKIGKDAFANCPKLKSVPR